MEKFLVVILLLLAGSIAFAVMRKLRGGPFFPRPDVRDGVSQPQSLKEMIEMSRSERRG